ncbi:hypothetical protein IEQ11_04150 [Lysobacter capsici]|uniref:hypothetical protein n=1 Tax=Lysobacter capsici TaxID=435897 RepID=UPI0017835557|nr:hypothetical protein [Lysobacter capsici]UOF15864.1 hypothetical protein IEQ11_04150 [Lysobacter capsici]
MHLCFPPAGASGARGIQVETRGTQGRPRCLAPESNAASLCDPVAPVKKEDTISYRRNISIQDGAVLIDPARPAAAAQASPKARRMPAPSIRAQAEAQATVRDGFFRNY